MSHFTVIVTRTNIQGESAEEQLAPFDENRRMPKYVLETREQIITNGKKKIEEYKNSTYAEFLKDPEKYKASTTNRAHIKYLEEEFPKKLEWTDEEIYQDRIKWVEENELTPEGGIYSDINPDAKWDWYEIGGRWSGYFKLKSDKQGALGSPGVFNNAPVFDADVAKLENIDWSEMKSEKYSDGLKRWGEYKKALKSGKKVDSYWDFGIKEGEKKCE
jgi:hypothetical protein